MASLGLEEILLCVQGTEPKFKSVARHNEEVTGWEKELLINRVSWGVLSTQRQKTSPLPDRSRKAIIWLM